MQIREAGIEALPLYASIPIAYEVRSKLCIVDQGLNGLLMQEEPVSPSYIKDYDRQDDGDSFMVGLGGSDLSRWGLFLAFDGDIPRGGAAVAVDTPAFLIPGDPQDIAVLWDIRVHPDRRGSGIGSMLFRRAADWTRQKGCRQLWCETQNVNVPACRFYARQGCSLGAIHRHGYAGCPEVAHEVMLLWVLEL